MPRYWFEDSWTCHRLIAVEAADEDEAEDKKYDSANWVHEEVNDSHDTGEWEATTAEEFRKQWGADNEVWVVDGATVLQKVPAQLQLWDDEISPQRH